MLLERLALADVAAVEHSTAHVLVVEKIRVLHLEPENRAVAVTDRAFNRVTLHAPRTVGCQELSEERQIAFAHQLVEAPTLELVDPVAEHALDRRALVRHHALGVEDGDQVGRVGDEGTETRLALPPMQVGRERCPLDCERDLRRERTECVDKLSCDGRRRRDDERPANLPANHQRRDDRRLSFEQRQIASHSRSQIGVEDANRVGAFEHEPVARCVADTNTARAVRRRREGGFAFRNEHESHRRFGSEQRMRCGDRRCCNLFVACGRNEIDARAPQRPLPRDDAFLLANQPGHPCDDQQEQHGRGNDEHEHVRVVKRLSEADRGSDQARAGEQDETDARQA